MFNIGRGKTSTFSEQDFIDGGWLPHDYDQPGNYQYPGQKLIIEETRINQEIITKSDEEIFDLKVNNYTKAVQKHLDSLARSWGYDNIISLCSYAADPNPTYSAEAMAGVIGRGQVWQYCYDQLELIKTEKRVEPESIEAFISELPVIERPE